MEMERNDHLFLAEDTIDLTTRLFKTLADPSRLKILYLLTQEECSVGHIAELLDMSPSAVSHQLGLLRALRLVKHRRDGKTLYYSCDDEHVISLLKQTIGHAEHRCT
jgi:DNA-binding transcriptional ArsR family regulator